MVKAWHILVGLLVLVVIIIAFNWEKFYSWISGKNATVVSPYDECIAKNKALADGVPCTSCLPNGGRSTGFEGVIANGICVEKVVTQTPAIVNNPKPVTYRLQVSNPNGARVYDKRADGNIVSVANAPLIPVNTVLDIKASVTSPQPYFSTQMGWVSGNDVTVIG